MTLTEFRYIVALARERHFGRAADKCNVSQPTLSVAVKKLEDELGVALFERSAGEVRVTPIGSEVVAQAERALAEAARVAEIAAAGKDPLAGPLRLGVIYTIGPWLLPALVPRGKALAPHMPLSLAEGYTENLIERHKYAELTCWCWPCRSKSPAWSRNRCTKRPSAPWCRRGTHGPG
jgi:LysR family hydrogen peroxide-inducible transcriptional activator